MDSPISKGAFIVLEGIDNSGKTTQCKKLVEYLEDIDIPVKYIALPDRTTPIGKLIDKVLTKQVTVPKECLHMLFAANRLELKEKMTTALQNGVTLVADRFSISGIVYGIANGLDKYWLENLEHGLLTPDLVFYLKIDPAKAGKRQTNKPELFENLHFQQRVYKLYNDLIDETDALVLKGDTDVDIIAGIIATVTVKKLKEINPNVQPEKFD